MRNLLAALTLIFTIPGSLAATELQSLENIAQELVRIRQQIEKLHNEISYETDTFKDQIRSYSNQKSDLDVRISRADLNIKDLQRELKKLNDMSAKKSKVDIAPVIRSAIETLRASISGSLPFKLPQRLKALDEIQYRLDTHAITPNKAANQLWAFAEDEFMLGNSSGIYNETMKIGGQDKLVKVLRIGKVAMFYQTSDEQYGVTMKQGDQWQQQEINGSENIAQLEHLFDSFNKNIRNGQFTVPNFLPGR